MLEKDRLIVLEKERKHQEEIPGRQAAPRRRGHQA